ncbi:MAG TPA: hypothetical protein VK867_01615 [Candidatus Limnocylindrales bacterium]|nr:hypothetical protein [Candidatus Limnocylindrales bacterium]
MHRLLALLVIAASVAACGGAPGGGPAASGALSAAAPAVPTGSFLTMAKAAAAYSAIAAPYNDAIDRAEERYGVRTTLEDHQRYWALIAKADAAFIAGLKKIAFPPEIQPDVDVLIRAEEAFHQNALATSHSRNAGEVLSLSAVANAAAEAATKKAAIVRAALGLGPSV